MFVAPLGVCVTVWRAPSGTEYLLRTSLSLSRSIAASPQCLEFGSGQLWCLTAHHPDNKR